MDARYQVEERKNGVARWEDVFTRRNRGRKLCSRALASWNRATQPQNTALASALWIVRQRRVPW